MADAESAEVKASEPVQSIESIPPTTAETAAESKEEAAAEENAEEDADAEEDESDGRPVSRDQYKALKAITDVLTNHKIQIKNECVDSCRVATVLELTQSCRDYFPSQLFKRIPNRRVLPDYHEIIKDPVAISTLKQKIQRKQYTGIPEFVRDFAMIVHNAQVYNRPNSAPVRDVFLLQDLFKEELKKLVEEGLVKDEETAFPDLGEIPDATPEPTPVSDDEEDEDEDDDEDEDGADDDSDDGRKKRRRKSGRASISGRKGREDDDKGGEPKRRGRPPKVDTPMESRIKAILRLAETQGQGGQSENPAFRTATGQTGLPQLLRRDQRPHRSRHDQEKGQEKEVPVSGTVYEGPEPAL
jgi:chromatin structure-remodeling complex subunit RSC1/2